MRNVNCYLYHSQCWASPMPISTVLSWQALLFAEALRTLSLSQVQNASIYYPRHSTDRWRGRLVKQQSWERFRKTSRHLNPLKHKKNVNRV